MKRIIFLAVLILCNACGEDDGDMMGQDGSDQLPVVISEEGSDFVLERIELPFGDDLRDIHFFDENTGIIVGGDKPPNFFSGVILRTENGGDAWEMVYEETAESFIDTYFIDDQIGYTVGVAGRLLRTLNGGKSWSVVEYTIWKNENSECEACYPSFRRIQFLDENMGYATISRLLTGDDYELPIGEDTYRSFSQFLKTEDGGKNWFILDKPVFNSIDLHFFNKDEGIVVGEYAISPPVTTLITKTYTGGVDLGAQVSEATTVWQSQQSFSELILELYFLNENIGYASSVGSIYKTTDQGGDWTKIAVPSTENVLFSNVFFPNENVGFTSSENAPFYFTKTSDGGNTWEVLKREQGINAMFFVSDKLGYLIENDGYLTRYTKKN